MVWREAPGLDRCRSPLAVPGRGAGVRSAPLPPVQTPRYWGGPQTGCPDCWRREPSAQTRPGAPRGKPRRNGCIHGRVVARRRLQSPLAAVAHRTELPREQAQADRAVLARVKRDGDARVEAVCDQVLRCRLEEARELAAAQRGVALVREDHADARGARVAYLLGVQRLGTLAGCSRVQWAGAGVPILTRRNPCATLSTAPPSALSKPELSLASRDAWLLRDWPVGSKRKSGYFSSISCTKRPNSCQGQDFLGRATLRRPRIPGFSVEVISTNAGKLSCCRVTSPDTYKSTPSVCRSGALPAELRWTGIVERLRVARRVVRARFRRLESERAAPLQAAAAMLPPTLPPMLLGGSHHQSRKAESRPSSCTRSAEAAASSLSSAGDAAGAAGWVKEEQEGLEAAAPSAFVSHFCAA
eukprot:scaffold38239_cov66-Phaeocystis_antarctica.AAC.2